MTILHVNTGGGANLRRRVGPCWGACGLEEAALVVNIPGSPYYADDVTCTSCGDSWSEGFLGARPFRRGWRQEAIADAAARWDVACECPVTRNDELYVLPCEHTGVAA